MRFVKNVKGMKDFLPEEQRLRNQIRNTLESTFVNYGYQSVETPMICWHQNMVVGLKY